MKKNFLLIISVNMYIALTAQQPVRNNGSLQLHAGASFTSFGDFTNSSAASLLNDGTISVKGNLTNDQAAMSAGTGVLQLNGSSAQSVNGSAMMKTYNLVTNNTAGITLNNDLSISGTHTFTAGLVHSSSTPNYLVYEAGAGHTGSTDNRHMTGWVKKNGSDDFIFPVGDNSYLRDAAISSLSASSVFNCHYYTPSQNNYNLASPLVKVKGNEYWDIEKVSGGNAQVTLNWDHAKVPMDNILLTDIRVGHFYSGNWNNEGGSASGNVTTTGSVTSNAISSFSPFTIGYISFPIPLKLVSFTGWRKSGITYLHWVSENEQDVSHFSVERSFDGNVFNSIAAVPARNRGIRELYSLNDPASFTGMAYYRLKNIDNDGKFSYSRVILVSEQSANGPAFLVQNPVQTAITVYNKTAPAGVYEYRLFSTNGQQVVRGVVSLSGNGACIIRLPMMIPHGIYTLDLQSSQIHYSQQILVEK